MHPKEERLCCHKKLKNLLKKFYENNVMRFPGTLLILCGSIFTFFFHFLNWQGLFRVLEVEQSLLWIDLHL